MFWKATFGNNLPPVSIHPSTAWRSTISTAACHQKHDPNSTSRYLTLLYSHPSTLYTGHPPHPHRLVSSSLHLKERAQTVGEPHYAPTTRELELPYSGERGSSLAHIKGDGDARHPLGQGHTGSMEQELVPTSTAGSRFRGATSFAGVKQRET